MVVSLTLDDTNRTILNNAYFKIIRDVLDVIKIESSSVVVIHKDIETTLTDNRTTVTGLKETNLPSTVALRRVVASIVEDFNENELTTLAVHQRSAFPIFEDPDINVSIYPIRIKSDITIDFSYITPSKTEATRIRDDIRIRLTQMRNITMHDIEYDILIPNEVEEFITDVHALKNRLLPQGLEDYFRENTTKRMHLITDMSNKDNVRIAIHEKQIRIIGQFDFNGLPEKIQIDNENNTYKVSFPYRLSFDVPRAIVLRYPAMICNKPLPAKYLQFIEDHKRNSMEEYKRNLGYSAGLYALSHFEAHRQLENRVDINLPINIPLFDDFNTRQGHKGYVILASFLTQIDETDKRTLLNLREIDPYYIPDTLINHIVNKELRYIINPYMSFLYLGLYQENTYFDNNILIVDDNLNVRSKVDLDLTKQVRVTLSFILDLTVLSADSYQRLINAPEVLLIFITEYIRVYNNFKTELSRDDVSEGPFYKTFLTITDTLMLREDVVTLKAMFNILKEDIYLYNVYTNILYTNYKNIYNYLLKNSIINLAETNRVLNKQHSVGEAGIMKTVMSNYVLALKTQTEA